MKGKVVLVTGGSAGIGKAAAKFFAEAGASVFIVERGQQAESEIKAAGGKILFVQTDVSNAGQVRVLIARIIETSGRLDCALNNAAVLV